MSLLPGGRAFYPVKCAIPSEKKIQPAIKPIGPCLNVEIVVEGGKILLPIDIQSAIIGSFKVIF